MRGSRLLLTTHYALLTTHYSLPTTHDSRLSTRHQAEHERRWEDSQFTAGLLQEDDQGRCIPRVHEPLQSAAWMASQFDALRMEARSNQHAHAHEMSS